MKKYEYCNREAMARDKEGHKKQETSCKLLNNGGRSSNAEVAEL